MRRDHHDAIIDQMLREILGGDRPRDMTARVLAQAKISDRFRRRKWIMSGLAVAAAAALTIGVIGAWPSEYPVPIAGGIEVTSGATFERGVEFEVPEEAKADAFVKLGGYVDMTATPQTVMTVGGTRYHEKVFLQRGNVHANVVGKTGDFEVVVGPVTVHATGAEFNVRVTNEMTETERLRKMVVGVREGSVEVQGLPPENGATSTASAPPPPTVTAGQRREFVIEMKPRPLPLLRAATNTATAIREASGRAETREALATRRVEGRGERNGTQTKPGDAASTRPNATQANAGALSNLRMMITTGEARRSGIMRHLGDVYFLETAEGNFFMFQKAAVATAHPEWMTLTLRQPTIVVWKNGEVTTVGQPR